VSQCPGLSAGVKGVCVGLLVVHAVLVCMCVRVVMCHQGTLLRDGSHAIGLDDAVGWVIVAGGVCALHDGHCDGVF
jgi:hypothetical protein